MLLNRLSPCHTPILVSATTHPLCFGLGRLDLAQEAYKVEKCFANNCNCGFAGIFGVVRWGCLLLRTGERSCGEEGVEGGWGLNASPCTLLL